MKKCELCKSPARAFCESDQASLCWYCDAKVHGANFLVARHSRGLLCHSCQSLTPWRASGSRLGRTISVCERCTGESHGRRREGEGGGGGGGGEGDDDDDDGEEDDGDGGSANNDDVDTEEDDLGDQDENDEADGDNQVVPWSSATPLPQPPVASSLSSASTSGGDSVSRFACSDGEFVESSNAISLKRTRDSPADPRSPLQEVLDPPFSQWKYNRSVLTAQARGCDFSSKPVKYQRTEPFPAVQAGSARDIETVKRF